MTEPVPEPVVGESRLPMALAVLALMALAVVSPAGLALLPGWLLAAVEGILLVALMIGDPGRIDRDTRWLRLVSFALVAVILISTLTATVLLLHGLLVGSAETQDAVKVLVAGAKVWLGNNVAFALLYWQFDSGGPAARAHGMPPLPGLRLPAAAEPRAGTARLASAVHRLPLCRLHERECVQPDRHDADGALGEGRDGLPGAHLVRDHRPRDRAGREPVHLGPHAQPRRAVRLRRAPNGHLVGPAVETRSRCPAT